MLCRVGDWFKAAWRFLARRRFGGRLGITRAYDWLVSHTIRRHHILNLSGQGDYKWGWCDRGHMILLAAFKLLVDYVEQEQPFERIEWDWSEPHRLAEQEIRELYRWWKTGRREEHEACDALVQGVGWTMQTKPLPDGSVEYLGRTYDVPDGAERWAAYAKRSEELDEKDNEMLRRLIAVRGYLWT